MAIENAIKSVSRIAYTTALTGLTNDDNLVLVTKGYVDSVASGIAVGEGNGITVSGTTVSVDGYGKNIKVDGNGVSATIPAWAANTPYVVGDVVYNNSVIYVCGSDKAHTSGNSFDSTEKAYWTAISSTITSTSHSHTSTQISDGVVAYDANKTSASYVVKTDGSTGKISSTLLPDLAITNVYVRQQENGRKTFESGSNATYTHAEAGDVVIESYTDSNSVAHNNAWMYVGANATSSNVDTTIGVDANWKQINVDPSPYALASHTHTINDLPYVDDLDNTGLDHSHVPTAGVLRQAITSLTNSLEGLTYSDVGAAPSSLSATVSSIKQVPTVNSGDGDKVLVSSYNSTTSTGSYAWGSVPSHTHTAAQLPGAYQEITVPSNNNKSSVSFNHEMTTEKLLVQVYERQGTDSNNYTYESVLVDTVVNGSKVTLNFASSPTAGKVYRVYVYPVYSNINATPGWA